MFKKTLHILSLIVCLLCGTAAQAYTDVSGRWTIFPVGGSLNKAVETPTRTYFLLGTGLFSLSYEDNEIYAYTAQNKLSDTYSITGIWYNRDEGFLLAAYGNGNIDVIYDDGRIVNIADIKDAHLPGFRTITDVAFGGGKIFVTTDFGLVVIDAKTHLVGDSGMFNTMIERVFVLGDHVVLVYNHNVLVAPVDGRHNRLDNFRNVSQHLWYQDIVPLGDNQLFYIHTSGAPSLGTIDFEAGTMKISGANIADNIADAIGPCGDDAWALRNGTFYVYGTDGSVQAYPLPEAYADARISAAGGLGSVWMETADGISRLDMGKPTPELTMQPFRPEALTMRNPAYMVWSADYSRLYMSNVGPTYHLAELVGDGFETVAKACYIEDGTIHNALPYTVNVERSVQLNEAQKRYKTKEIVGGPSRLAVDPDDPSTIYLPVRRPGMFVVREGEYVNLLNDYNVPYSILTDWAQNVFLAGVDQGGNLWFSLGYRTPSTIYVLPAEKRRNKIDKVEKGDWLQFRLPTSFLKPNRDYFVTFCKKSNYNFLSYGDYAPGIVIMDNNGTPDVFTDDKLYHVNVFVDQNGQTINTENVTCVTEDATGKVWVGTALGVFVINDPSQVTDETMTVHRPIVPRNDGTNLGDYLMGIEKVSAIAVDPSNRKWFATESSGVYLVSADGTEILANYNTSNSPLPSNCVYTVAADPYSNKVYFGTKLGAACFESDSSPAAEDFSEIYAYPNPVRPEYTGLITVKGLMDGSLVKIADAAGNVFYQGRSEGGMIVWDGCDATGDRVRSGVYYVFASQSADGGSAKGAVTKILVVN